MMEKLNPFYKAMTILIAGILLSFNYSVILNMSLFVISMVLIFGFSYAKKEYGGKDIDSSWYSCHIAFYDWFSSFRHGANTKSRYLYKL